MYRFRRIFGGALILYAYQYYRGPIQSKYINYGEHKRKIFCYFTMMHTDMHVYFKIYCMYLIICISHRQPWYVPSSSQNRIDPLPSVPVSKNAYEQPAPDADTLDVYADNNTERDQKSEWRRRERERGRTMLAARRGFVSIVHTYQCKQPIRSRIVAAERAVHPALHIAPSRNARHS